MVRDMEGERKLNILIVDDEPVITELLREFLGGQGYEVLVASNVTEAMASFKRDHPDVVLLDILLPESSGFTLLYYLRENLPDTQVIMLSGVCDLETQKRALSEGAIDYLTKPLNLDLVAQTVKYAVKRLGIVKGLP